VTALVYIGGNELRAAEIRRIVTGIELTIEALQTGFSTSAPEPTHRAHDKVMAHPVTTGAFAEAEDLTTMDGKSLRLELDSENANRFCKWWRETPAQMHLVVALRRAPGAAIELFTGTCDGRIADKPAGPPALGWDRLFVPVGEDYTLGQLIEAGEAIPFRSEVYAAMARALCGA
jgi:inosine/xanthosine triphosphate pyrophosphatase family protein